MVDFSGSGIISGNVTAQRYISGVNNAWRGFSAPVAATYSDISSTLNLGTRGQNGSNLISLRDMAFWKGSSWQFVSNWRIAADTFINATSTSAITPGRGFLAYGGTNGVADLSSPVTLDLTGSLNSSVIGAPGLVKGDKPYNGWIMMGNPYLATLDWKNMYGTSDVSGISSTIYFYNTSLGIWNSYNAVTNTGTGNGSNVIAPFQAFMVKANSSSIPTMNFRTSQTSVSASNYNFRQQHVYPIVRLNVEKNGALVQTALTLMAAQASSGFDSEYDSPYPGSFNGHDFYSLTGVDIKLQQNSRPLLPTGISEPYYFEFNGTGSYSISSTFENIDPTWSVFLEDKINGAMHNLRNGAYAFNHQPTNMKDRFVLHINSIATGVYEHGVNDEPIVSIQNDVLSVRFGAELKNRKLEVIDLEGRILRTILMENSSSIQIDIAELAQSVYLLRTSLN
jgi:hypothetical protein